MVSQTDSGETMYLALSKDISQLMASYNLSPFHPQLQFDADIITSEKRRREKAKDVQLYDQRMKAII